MPAVSIYLSCLLAIIAVGTAGHATDQLPKNIILIMADDLGYETIGANGGSSYETPNLDRLAERGVRFEHCYSQPLCTPSRVQIMTGKYNARNYQKFGVLPRSEKTFAHLLKEAGFTTCIAGKWQLGREADAPQHFGFNQALLWQHTDNGRLMKDGVRYDKRFENPMLQRNGVEELYTNGEYAPDLMVDFICEFIESNQSQPFLVYYPMILTHCPFTPTPDSEDWNPENLGSPTYKGKAKHFGDMVAYMDKLVGRIVAELEAQGLRENTLIIFTGDNGTDKPIVSLMDGREVAGEKGKMTNGGTRVPLIANLPGQVKPAVSDALVDFSDFLPTICDYAGVEIAEKYQPLDGQSFLPQLLGQPSEPREWIYCWYSRTGKIESAEVFARNQRYKVYQNGDFFDVENDVLEMNPLSIEVLSDDQQKVKTMLSEVVSHYQQFQAEEK